ncbi:MAG: TRAP transporter fused permease subunit [Ruminococcaceae bacterium]|nr:TRAP transporter fused permease subunit [Oscillospiraceae bacterium]
MAEFDRESNVRQFHGIPNTIIRALFLAFVLFTFGTRFITLPEQVRMSSFLGIIMFLGFLIYPLYKKQTKKHNFIPWYDMIFAVVGSAPFFYYAINFREITNRAVAINQMDKIMALVGIIFLFELCRRAVGLPILFVAGGFIAYAFYYGKSLNSILYNLFYTTNGIPGTPLNVCSTFIVFFIILGAFLEKTGIGTFFVDLANSVAGWASGGPAKVAVISSALEGMYSGSSVANTVGSGSVTIPVMKSVGYKSEFAAAVEAAASTGGQIMPPIMGAAAFLMSEITGVSYVAIAIAAILPAVLYFTGIFVMIHFEAKKLGLKGLPKDSIPNFFKLIVKKGYLFLPIIVLVALMSAGKTPAMSACMAIVTTMAIMLITDVVKLVSTLIKGESTISAVVDLILMLVPVALFAVGTFAMGYKLEDVALIAGLCYIILSLVGKSTKESGKVSLEALETGMRNTMGVCLACGLAGIVAGVVTLTSLGSTLINVIVPIAQNNLFIALFLTMLTCIVLGMGVPTTANYLIMATITAPILTEMGLPLLAAHMFVFYFGIVADITPPVALAAYAGSAIAKSNPLKTGVTATRLAITAFIIPYIFAYSPAMLIVDPSATGALAFAVAPLQLVQIIITSLSGIFALSAGMEGYMFTGLKWWQRIILVAAGLTLIEPTLLTDIIGLVLISASILMQYFAVKKETGRSTKGISAILWIALALTAVFVIAYILSVLGMITL